jgi:hypothetical protein
LLSAELLRLDRRNLPEESAQTPTSPTAVSPTTSNDAETAALRDQLARTQADLTRCEAAIADKAASFFAEAQRHDDELRTLRKQIRMHEATIAKLTKS